MRKTRLLLLAATCCLLSMASSAQNAPTDANAKSDQSMQGNGKMGDLYNVNLFDGTANIDIPIYNYNIDGLDLGVSLTYDARGIKVDQPASSVGLNWSLLAGGYIERTIHGVPDENWPATLKKHVGNSQHLPVNCPDDIPIDGAGVVYKGKWCFDPNGQAENDKEDDLFNVNIGGTSFKMTIHDMAYDNEANLVNVTTFPKREVKVKVYHNNALIGWSGAWSGLDESNPNDGITIEITDEKGNNFYFSPGDIEYSYNNAPLAVNPYHSYRCKRWVITKVETATGNTINYFYRKFDNISFAYYRDQQIQERWEHFEVIDNVNTYFNDTLKVEADSIVNWQGSVSHIQRIDYPNGASVIFNFEDDPNHQRCDMNGRNIVKSITIEGKLDNLYTINDKTFRFDYAYFHSPINGNTNTEIPYSSACSDIRQTFGLTANDAMQHQLLGLRLKLKGIDIIGADNITSQPYYTFDYNSTPLPERLSASQDYFGYYNGKTPQYSVSNITNPAPVSKMGLPLHTYTYTSSSGGGSVTYGTDRTPDINYMRACNLIKVKNAFGGEVEFSYKDHSLYNPTNSYTNNSNPLPIDYQGDNANDGLCIDKITFRDGYNTDNTTITKYEFEDGQRFFRGGYFWYYEFASGPGSFGYISGSPSSKTLYTNNYVTPLMFVNESNHGYSYATVKSYGYNNEYLGAVKYKFSNLMDQSGVSNLKMNLESYKHTFHPIYFYDYKIGLLLETSDYDINGDITSKTENVYDVNAHPYGWTNYYVNSRTGAEAGHHPDPYHEFESIKMVKLSTTSTQYAGPNSISNTLNFTYDAYDNLQTASWTDAYGDINTKKFFYNYSNVNGQPYFDNTTYSLNRQYLVTTEIWKNTGGNDYILGYKYVTPPGGIQGINNSRSLKTNAPVALAQYNNASFLTTAVTEDTRNSYDDKHNIIETKHDGGLMYSAAIWDTRIGQKIAEATNAKYSQIAYTSFEGAYGPQGTFEYSKGNWDFNPTGIVYSVTNGLVRPMTGRYHYQLIPGQYTVSSFYPLENGISYQLSFWATSTPNIQVGTQTITPLQLVQKQYWRLYTAKITGNGTPVTISSSSGTIHIDELRLHPFNGSMSTLTFEPLVGPSSHDDGNNNISYIEYDVLGNAKVVRDVNGNIRSLTKQVTQGSDN